MSIMTALGGLIGTATGTGISETLSGVGDAAIKLRTAITGNLPPEKAAELEAHLADVEARLSEAQNKVNGIEAQSASFLVAGWRPIVGWICAFGVAYAFLFQPMAAWLSTGVHIPAPPVIDVGTLLTLLFAMLGLGGLRTFEKTKGIHNEH